MVRIVKVGWVGERERREDMIDFFLLKNLRGFGVFFKILVSFFCFLIKFGDFGSFWKNFVLFGLGVVGL